MLCYCKFDYNHSKYGNRVEIGKLLNLAIWLLLLVKTPIIEYKPYGPPSGAYLVLPKPLTVPHAGGELGCVIPHSVNPAHGLLFPKSQINSTKKMKKI